LRHLHGLLAALADAAHNDIVDRGWIDARAPDNGIKRCRREIDRVHPGKPPAAPAPSCANCIDDIGSGHCGGHRGAPLSRCNMPLA